MASAAQLPAPWTRTMEVRAHDLDHTATLGPVGLIRMAESMRWRVFATDLRGSHGRAVVRAQCIEVLGTAGYGQEITQRMWVSHVGRTSMTLAHDVAVVGQSQVIARLASTIVATDPEGRPTAVGDVVRGFLRQDPALSIKRELPGSAPEDAFSHTILVQQHDLDLLQHVNQARYMDFANSARYAAADAGAYPQGFDGARALRRMDLAYDDEARRGATLHARTWVLDDDRVAVLLYDATDGRLLNRAELVLAPAG